MARNYFRAPESDGRAGIARGTEMTDLVQVSKSREGRPEGARTETYKNEPDTARRAHRESLLIIARPQEMLDLFCDENMVGISRLSS
jgi:hypothetical protein